LNAVYTANCKRSASYEQEIENKHPGDEGERKCGLQAHPRSAVSEDGGGEEVVSDLELRSISSGGEAVMTPLDTREASQFLKRSPAAVRNMVLRRIIPYRKVSGRLMFIQEELEEWIKRCPGVSIDDLEAE
jgi:hypothetical protein